MIPVLYYAHGFGQIEIQERRNRPLPPGWAVDADGKVSSKMSKIYQLATPKTEKMLIFRLDLEYIYYMLIEIL